jgi:hypothetical protein
LAGETEVLGENLPQCHLVHHKSHMTCTGFEPRAAAVGSQRITARAMARPKPDSMYAARRVLFVGFEVLTAVVMKSSVFCDITPLSPVNVNGHFRGICRLHLEVRRIRQARKEREAGRKQNI